MQERAMTSLMADAFNGWNKQNKGLLEDQETVKSNMVSIEVSNNLHFADKKLPDYTRTPTAAELLEMRQFAIDLKSQNKNMSKRQIRKATQEKFNIKIYR